MGLRTEVAAWIRFVFRTPKHEKSIVFYSEQASYWPYLEGLVEELKRRQASPFCYITSDPEDPILAKVDHQINVFYLRRLLPLFLLFVNCRAFIMTLTELNLMHIRRSIHGVHYVYVFHSMNSSHMAYQPCAFDHYDSILCCGPYQVHEIQRDEEQRNLPKKELIESGYYRLERVYHAAQKHLGRAPATQIAEQNRHVLIAPSWAVHNVLEEHAIPITEALLEAGYQIVMRPHPETCKRNPDLVKGFTKRFEDNDSVVVEHSVTSDESLLQADVLITDWSGVAQEYAFGTERPVLYLDVPRKVHNTRYTELGIEPFEASIRSEVGLVLPVTDISKVAEVVRRLIQDRDTYLDRIRSIRSENVFSFGNSSEVGVSHILDVIARAESTARKEPK